MRCIKINMVYPPMHHFLNVSGFTCFFLAPFHPPFNVSHFERTAWSNHMLSPSLPPAVAGPEDLAFLSGGPGLLPAAASVWTETKLLFLVRCYALRVFNRNSVCCFCFFVKVKFVFLSNITKFYIPESLPWCFFFLTKRKQTHQNAYMVKAFVAAARRRHVACGLGAGTPSGDREVLVPWACPRASGM